jgi:hypothetical protein
MTRTGLLKSIREAVKEIIHARQVSEDARQVRKEDGCQRRRQRRLSSTTASAKGSKPVLSRGKELGDGCTDGAALHGENIETLPREKLLEVIDCLLNELDLAHNTVRQIIELNKLTREVRQRDRDTTHEFWARKLGV